MQVRIQCHRASGENTNKFIPPIPSDLLMYDEDWLRGCVAVWLRGCVAAWLRGCVADSTLY